MVLLAEQKNRTATGMETERSEKGRKRARETRR